MANEITITASLSGYKSSVMAGTVGRSITGLLISMAGNPYVEGVLSVATSPTPIPQGGVTAPGWCFLLNKDAANFVRVMNGSGGAKVVKLKAGEPAFFRWDDTGTPYAQADTAACLMEFLIFSL